MARQQIVDHAAVKEGQATEGLSGRQEGSNRKAGTPQRKVYLAAKKVQYGGLDGPSRGPQERLILPPRRIHPGNQADDSLTLRVYTKLEQVDESIHKYPKAKEHKVQNLESKINNLIAPEMALQGISGWSQTVILLMI